MRCCEKERSALHECICWNVESGILLQTALPTDRRWARVLNSRVLYVRACDVFSQQPSKPPPHQGFHQGTFLLNCTRLSTHVTSTYYPTHEPAPRPLLTVITPNIPRCRGGSQISSHLPSNREKDKNQKITGQGTDIGHRLGGPCNLHNAQHDHH